jgi:putative membrane protein
VAACRIWGWIRCSPACWATRCNPRPAGPYAGPAHRRPTLSETAPRPPRILLEEEAGAARLDHAWEATIQPAAIAPSSLSTLSLLAIGLVSLILGFAALSAGNYVAEQFARAIWLGWLTLAVALGGFGAIGWAILREFRALFRLREVDAARAAFARGDLAGAKRHVLAWAAPIPLAEPALPALREAPDLHALRALLESGPLAALDSESRALGRLAAVQGFAATAISPTPALDALVVGWRGLRLVRQVAALHGMRPGIAATASLLRRAAFDAATVAATEVATDTAVRAIVTNPLIGHVVGEAATGAVAARRLITLARATAAACRIVPRD